ncbi:chemotaxis protein CheW [Myxococcota bacterium]|nr:chemotaxis protein CheW [Myxococcota bacterium]MBU1379427.1 chemotaxis protein CheW [Myxococcota bacterium]MBU1497630.1 chemotaxis protein CheW [Myxococcota bacterium]
MDNNDLELLQEFVVESTDHLSNVENDLALLADGDSSPDLLNRIFRAVHSVKGAAGFFGLTKINKLSHQMETLLMKIRDGERQTDPLTIDVLVKCNDKLVNLLENIETSEDFVIDDQLKMLGTILENAYSSDENFGDFLQRLGISSDGDSDYEGSDEELDEPLPPKVVEPVPDIMVIRAPVKLQIPKSINLDELNRFGHSLYRFSIPWSFFGNSSKILKTIEEWEKLGKVYELHIPSPNVESEEKLKGVSIEITGYISTVLKNNLISEGLEIPEEYIEPMDTGKPAKTTVPVVEKEKPALKQEKPVVKTKKPESPTNDGLTQVISEAMKDGRKTEVLSTDGNRGVSEETVRVKTSLLDSLMQTAGELVLARNRLLRIMKNNEEEVDGLSTVLHQIDGVTSSIQSQIMKTRLQPIGNLFKKFPRVIRELELKLNKEVNLIIKGKEVELDKTIIENLSDILTHIIRNSMDHGIEDPDYRETAGKVRKGTIILSAYYEGGMVNIDVEDDGRGIDRHRVAKKAIERGLITKEEAENGSDREIVNLLFAPGFSTAEQVSDVSGRGVGMDVVKTNIEKLGGNAEINTTFGKGTLMNLKLPLTLAIIPSLIFEVENHTYAIHQVALEEALRIREGDPDVKIEKINQNMVLRHRDSLLPLINLADVLKIRKTFVHPETGKEMIDRRSNIGDLRESSDSERRQTYRYHRVLVLRAGRFKYGLIVDRILDNEEIVIKPLSSLVKTSPAFSGATILGDGTIAIILDAIGIIQQSRIKFHELEKLDAHKEEESIETGEVQSLFFFDNGSREKFAIPLNLIKRIEKVDQTNLKIVGNKEYITTTGNKFVPVLRLENLLDVGAGDSANGQFYVIHPKLVRKPVCIVARTILDISEVRVQLDRKTIQMDGIVGSSLIDNEIVLLLNIYRLFELFDPDSFATTREYRETIDPAEYRILLVEDTPFFRMIENDYLVNEGFEVITATNGLEAIDILEDNGPFDIIVTDIVMPHLDGIGLLDRVRRSGKYNNLPVMAVTSLDDDKSVQKGIEAGFDAYELKLDREKLLKSVYRLLQRKVS